METSTSVGHMPGEKWAFDEAVAGCFDDMLARSIPQYDVMRDAVARIAARHARPAPRIPSSTAAAKLNRSQAAVVGGTWLNSPLPRAAPTSTPTTEPTAARTASSCEIGRAGSGGAMG